MVVSRISNSKGIELKEEGIVNEVLKLSTTGLEITKLIHLFSFLFILNNRGVRG